MANTARNKPGAEQITDVEEVKVLDNLMTKYESNKKRINTIVTVVLAAVVGYFAYDKLYSEPRESKAATAMAFAQRYFEADSVDKALNGDGQHQGFLKVLKKYSGTTAGNLCNYYAGICYLHKGDFKNAIKYLEDFNGSGTQVRFAAAGALGDAYMENNNSSKAIDAYKKAVENTNDNILTPIYMYRLATVYEMSNKTEEAKKYYQTIKDEYPQSEQAREVEKYLGRLGEHD
ncbi:MAG: tetratricopeptide repeat protein [Flavipsychrobacter sp.]|nr:tetratricopeptide repeat protein [Flavipsychrobacter sp.]